MTEQNMIIHLVAGGLAGTTGAVLTCPLEVVKTRFQANICKNNLTDEQCNNSQKILTQNTKVSTTMQQNNNPGINIAKQNTNEMTKIALNEFKNINKTQSNRLGIGILLQLRTIVHNEGYRALFKGLVPNMIGVAPYRAIYFFSYANSKVLLLDVFKEENSLLHVCSAFVAGFSAVTITNPVWFVKTRLQLDQSKNGTTAFKVTQQILKEKGILGFYKGITASYFGISETAIYFVLYEQLKLISINREDTSFTFVPYLTSAGVSKTLASCICYPHEVARTRLRQVGNKYKGFFQTLGLVLKEEGAKGLYKGMATHLIKQIPNTAIIMTTYELIVNNFMNCK